MGNLHLNELSVPTLAQSLYGVFPGLLGQFTSVMYPGRTLEPRDQKRIGRAE